MGSVPVATSFLSIFYIYSTFFGRIKALWGANPPFRGHNPAIFANRLTLFARGEAEQAGPHDDRRARRLLSVSWLIEDSQSAFHPRGKDAVSSARPSGGAPGFANYPYCIRIGQAREGL